MSKYLRILLIFTYIVLTSCEDVIDVEVPTAEPRLVIEASLDWEKGTTGNEQTIKLSTSTPYFDTFTNTSVTGASVVVINDNDGTEFVFEDQNNGDYTTTSFIPELNQSYTLEVQYNGESYMASETLMSVTDIVDVTQSVEGGFDDEALEVNYIFIDPEDEENYYLVKFQREGDLLPVLEDSNDEFVNGNSIEYFFEYLDEDGEEGYEFVPGDTVYFELYGTSKQYNNYIQILIEQAEGGNLFSTTPAPLRGNCINLTNSDNYAFGYFRLSQFVKETYTFQ